MYEGVQDMPIQQIVDNSKQIATNVSAIQILLQWSQFIFPIVGVIIAVFTWAWKRMQRSIDRLEDALVAHSEKNEENFDSLFQSQRTSDAQLHRLLGEHAVMHGNIKGVPDHAE